MQKIALLLYLCLFVALPAGYAADGRPAGEDPAAPAQAYFAEGQAQEQAGNVVEAARMYKLALTLTPGAPAIAAALEGVQNRRQQMAEDRYQRGEQDYAAGEVQESKIAYLAALRLWPEHAGALERLREREKVTATHTGRHIVQKGETLTSIARKYYGDARKYQVIARYNRLADAAQIGIGQEIMIPEIGSGVIPAAGQAADGEDQPLAAGVEASIAEAVEIQLANYRESGQEMVRAGLYPAAIIEFGKVLNVLPGDPAVRRDLIRAHDAYGRQLWDRGEIDPAREQFQAGLALKKGCPGCRKAIAACESSYKERLYERGIALLQEGNPQAALAEWEIVKSMDPGYRNVKASIRKAAKALKQADNSPGKPPSP